MMQICIYKSYDQNILHFIFFLNFVFRQRRNQQEAFFGGIFLQKAEPQRRSHYGLFVVNVRENVGITTLFTSFDVSSSNLGGSIEPPDPP